MERVFFHERMLSFDPKADRDISKVQITNMKSLRRFVFHWLKDEAKEDTVIFGYDLKQMKTDFLKLFQYVEAAGGVVSNKNDQVLFIRRWDRWDLPKGKKEKKESIAGCALREVEEETGVDGLRIVKPLHSSYHLFLVNKKWHLKKTYWFLMETGFNGAVQPQKEEDITEVTWLNSKQCDTAMRETYRSLRDALNDEVCRIFGES